jgi:uncharacterized membrane protein YhaH (DUF805 family)
MNTIPMLGAQPQPVSRFFSLRGRIGRARYIAYSLGAVACTFLVLLLCGYALILSGRFGRMLYVVISVVLLYGFLPLLFAMLTVKRAHDFNTGGWIALLLMVPVINLIFWFLPGSRGDNQYGAQPQPDPSGIKLIAAVLPVLLVGTFLATQGNRINSGKSTSSMLKPHSTLKSYTP